jgi:hypothetical protein
MGNKIKNYVKRNNDFYTKIEKERLPASTGSWKKNYTLNIGYFLWGYSAYLKTDPLVSGKPILLLVRCD